MDGKDQYKIDISKLDLDKEKTKIADIPGLLAYPHHVGGQAVKPEDKRKIKGRAISAMREQTDLQMAQIYRQIQLLAEQAAEIKRRVEISERIYLSQINFEPVIGQIYFLYEKKDGQATLSMISPDEWGSKCPYAKCLATVKLLSDHTWEVIDDKAGLQ